MKYMFSNDLFFRNFRYLKEQSRISRRTLAYLMGVPEKTVRAIEYAKAPFTLEVEIVSRFAEIFAVDETMLLTADIASRVRPMQGPQPTANK